MQAAAIKEAKPPKGIPAEPLSRVTKTVARPASFKKTAKELHLAGTYRVIHGSIEIVRPHEDWHHADGSVNEHEPKTVRASAVITYDKDGKVESAHGDEVWLNDEDAARLLAMHIEPEKRHLHAVVEPLDAKPSRVGKVWTPPAITQRA